MHLEAVEYHTMHNPRIGKKSRPSISTIAEGAKHGLTPRLHTKTFQADKSLILYYTSADLNQRTAASRIRVASNEVTFFYSHNDTFSTRSLISLLSTARLAYGISPPVILILLSLAFMFPIANLGEYQFIPLREDPL